MSHLEGWKTIVTFQIIIAYHIKVAQVSMWCICLYMKQTLLTEAAFLSYLNI